MTDASAAPAGPEALPAGAVWVRLPRFIGDAIMIHQALQALRLAGTPLVAWGPASVVELFRGSGCFQGLAPDAGRKPGARDLARLLRLHSPAAVINLPRSQRASMAALLARVPLRAGWREGLGWLFCTRSLPYKRLEGHQVDRYGRLMSLAFPGTSPVEEARIPPFDPGPGAAVEAEALLAEAPGLFVAFGLGAMSWSKRLGTETWIALARALEARGFRPVLLGAPGEDQRYAAEIRAACPACLDLSGRTPLPLCAAVIRRCRALVGNDSALSHLAALCAVPTVLACGPTLPGVTAPRQPWVRVVRKEGLGCLGCMRGDCPVEGHPCMHELGVERILEALEGLGALRDMETPCS